MMSKMGEEAPALNIMRMRHSVRLGTGSLVGLSRGEIIQGKQPIGIESRFTVWGLEGVEADTWIEGRVKIAAQLSQLFTEPIDQGKPIW